MVMMMSSACLHFAGASSAYSVPGNGQSGAPSNGDGSDDIKHPHLHKLVEKVPFIHHSNN